MTEATLAVTAGSGTLLRTDTKSISSNTVHREYFLLDDPSLASYTVTAENVAVATANSHLLQIMAGSSLNVRIRRIRIRQRAVGTAAGVTITFFRLSTAGTGGTAITPAKLDTADAASGATAMTLPTAKGTESTQLWGETFGLVAAAPTAAANGLEWIQLPNCKPIIIAAGTSNGLAIKNIQGVATDTVDITVELTETSYV